MNFNRVFLVGNLTRNPEVTYTPSQTAVCSFGMAINKRWKDQQGQQKEKTCFVDCVIFGKGGEVFEKYMLKGNQVLVEGELDFSQWETQEGQKRSKLKVNVKDFQFLGQQGDPKPESKPDVGQDLAKQYNDSLPSSDEPIPF